MKRKSKPNFWKGNYSKCIDFAREFKWHFVCGLGIFALFFLIGFVFPVFFIEEIVNFVLELEGMLEGMSTLKLVQFILFNNLKASFVVALFGIFFGILPIVMATMNGYLLGVVSHGAVAVEGPLILWRLLPHGIFELPAVLFSIAIGLKIGFDVMIKSGRKNLKDNLVEGFRFFVFVVLPLLVVAAVIEGVLVGFG